MRGKVGLTQELAVPKGITPAYAGKSKLVHPVENSTQDHPRLCGEKS